MEEIKIKKITKIDENNLNKITEWMHEWWGKNEMHTFEEVKNSLNIVYKKIDYHKLMEHL